MTERQVQEYAEWLAAERGIEVEEALAYARRPRPSRYEPTRAAAPPAPRWDNVIYLDDWRKAS